MTSFPDSHHLFTQSEISRFKLWKHPFAQVIFDSDPAPKAGAATTQQEQMSQAMIRSVKFAT